MQDGGGQRIGTCVEWENFYSVSSALIELWDFSFVLKERGNVSLYFICKTFMEKYFGTLWRKNGSHGLATISKIFESWAVWFKASKHTLEWQVSNQI